MKITIKDLKHVLNEFADTMAKLRAGKEVEPHYELSFPTAATMRKFLTPQRMRLLQAIKHQNPESVYELAKMVDRDLKSVNTDLKVLSDLDLVSLEKTNDARRRVIPHVDYDKINVEIEI